MARNPELLMGLAHQRSRITDHSVWCPTLVGLGIHPQSSHQRLKTLPLAILWRRSLLKVKEEVESAPHMKRAQSQGLLWPIT
jgi:predicted ATPase